VAKNLSILIVLACLSFALSAHSQEAASAGEQPPSGAGQPSLLDEIVVVAGGLAQSIFDSARSVSVLNQEELSLVAPRSTPEALSDATGVFVQRTNHGAGSPIIRGLIGPQNLILVDGVRLNNSIYRTGPNQYLNLIDPFILERIEILRGPGSVSYGSDAMGGVIALAPVSLESVRRAPNELGSELTLRTASADLERSAHAKLDYHRGGFAAVASGTVRGFDDLSGGRGVGIQGYSAYDTVSASARAGYLFDSGTLSGWSADANYLFMRIDDAGRADQLASKHTLQFYDNIDHLAYLKLGGPIDAIDSTLAFTTSYQYFFESKRSNTLNDEHDSLQKASRDDATVHTIGLSAQLDTQLHERLRTTVGANWYHDEIGAAKEKRGAELPWESDPLTAYPDGSSSDTVGAFLTVWGAILEPNAPHRLDAEGGVRVQSAFAHAPARPDIGAADWSNTGLVFMADLAYSFEDSFTAALSFSQGFRSPNLNESVALGDDGKLFHIPNTELSPERSNTLELLSRVRLGALEFGVSGYLMMLSDFIRREEASWNGESEIGNKPVERNVNADEATIWGTEVDALLSLGLGFELRASGTYTWGEESEGGNDEPMSRVPPLFGQLGVRFTTPAAWSWAGRIETFFRAADRQDRLSPSDVKDPRIPDGGTPGWMSWHLRACVDPTDYLQLNLNIENVLDAKYKTHGSGLYAAGTNVILGLSARY
jgi:hemoglobin/transferrin/lactoferrin receptor protein